ncbi:MAG: hypothetical protein HY879_14345 [Deltaproteobacteria bacterium]|nr:hypothetical protein [Deltaproteobacteria bacterium]
MDGWKGMGKRIAVLILISLVWPAVTEAEGLYLRGGMGLEWALSADFQDKNPGATNPPALFGEASGSDGRPIAARGGFGRIPLLEMALGLKVLPWLRTDISLAHRFDMNYSGQANFRNVPGDQPVSTQATSTSGLVNIFVELSELLDIQLGPLKPYLGGGLGLAYNRLDQVKFLFPGLTRHKITLTPSGENFNPAFMLTVGTGWVLSKHLVLDVAFRYCDLGRVSTDPGRAFMNHVPSGIEIDSIHSLLSTQGLFLGLRYYF